MEPMHKISPTEEAELRIMTAQMFKEGGMENVLDCIDTMCQAQDIILDKLEELLHERGHLND